MVHVRLRGAPMIVCSCNVLTDHAIRKAVETRAPRTAGQVYGCLGCSAQCGRCAQTIRQIMDDAVAGACAKGCAAACHHHPHTAAAEAAA
jgi:bacterioferritin-associated ferredoxin